MRVLPHGRDIVAAALPVDDAFGPPRLELRHRHRSRVVFVRGQASDDAERTAIAAALAPADANATK